jgi:CubicO group peptidase (beta-lactamase class C family)
MFRTPAFAVALVVLSRTTSPLPAQETRPAPTEVAPAVADALAAVFKDWSDPAAPGAAVAVYRGGRAVYARGFGAASLEHEVAIGPRTRFDLASTSKQFTAACVALLVLDGKLSLDDPLRRHVPSLPAWADATTIRHCLFHTSGIRDYLALLAFSGKDYRDVAGDADALRALERQRALSFPVGSKHDYSNSGYFLLSQVVRAASGKSLAAFARERIFAPLGMTETDFVDDQTRVVPRRATAYEKKGGRWAISMSDWEQTGDGGVVTNVEDLAKWVENFATGKVGGPPFLALMATRGALDDGTALDYGFGLSHHRAGDVVGISHAGGWAGYRAELFRLPDEDLAVAVLANRADADPTTKAQQALKVAREAGLGSRPPAVAGAPASKPASRPRRTTSRPAPPPPVDATPAYLAAFVGAYRSDEVEATWTLTVEKRGLRVRGPGGVDETLFPAGRDVFASMGGTSTFVRDAADRPTRFTVKMRGLDGLVFERVAP